MPRHALRLLSQQSLWFVIIGAAASLFSALVYLLARQMWAPMAANGLAVALSALASSHAHRLLTFRRTPASRARLHAQNLVVAAVYFVSNTFGLAILRSIAPGADPRAESLTLLAVSCCVGVGRFLLLRLWVFRARPKVPAGDVDSTSPLEMLRHPSAGRVRVRRTTGFVES